MKKYVILFIIFLSAATATVIAGRKNKNNNLQYSALGKTFQCSFDKEKQNWLCTLPQNDLQKERLVAFIWKVSQQEQDKAVANPDNSENPFALKGKSLTLAKARQDVIEFFTNAFGSSIQQDMLFCPQKDAIAGYAISQTSKVEVDYQGSIRKVDVPIPSAEIFYKITPQKVVTIVNPFAPNLKQDMLHHPEKITFENLQSLWNQQALPTLCELP